MGVNPLNSWAFSIDFLRFRGIGPGSFFSAISTRGFSVSGSFFRFRGIGPSSFLSAVSTRVFSASVSTRDILEGLDPDSEAPAVVAAFDPDSEAPAAIEEAFTPAGAILDST